MVISPDSRPYRSDAPLQSSSSSGRSPAGLTTTAWSPCAQLTLADWVRQGRWLGALGRGSGWWIGDWVRYGTARYGDRYGPAARVTGYDVQSLRNMAYVAGRFQTPRRRDALSFSHHAELAGLPLEEQDLWLDRAEAGRCQFAPCARSCARRSDGSLRVGRWPKHGANVTQRPPPPVRRQSPAAWSLRLQDSLTARGTRRGLLRAPDPRVACTRAGQPLPSRWCVQNADVVSLQPPTRGSRILVTCTRPALSWPARMADERARVRRPDRLRTWALARRNPERGASSCSFHGPGRARADICASRRCDARNASPRAIPGRHGARFRSAGWARPWALTAASFRGVRPTRQENSFGAGRRRAHHIPTRLTRPDVPSRPFLQQQRRHSVRRNRAPGLCRNLRRLRRS